MQQKNIFSETFTIRSSETDTSGKATMQALCGLLQEAAARHALELHFGISELMQQKMTWVLHRLQVQVDRLPKWGESVTIQTWPSGGDTLRAYRDFLLLDEDNNEIGRSLSYWLILNIESRRPVRIPDQVLQTALKGIPHVLKLQNSRLKDTEDFTHSTTFSVRHSDLDINRHVNNVRYVEWMLEGLPPERKPSEIDIEFRAECTFGDTVESQWNLLNGGLSHHRIKRQKDDALAALAVSKA